MPNEWSANIVAQMHSKRITGKKLAELTGYTPQYITDDALSGTDFGFAPVAAIVVICYLVAAALKATSMDNKWLPVICGVCGGLLGALGMIIMPEYPAQDWMTAAAVGIVSGLAATGVNQIGKQLGGN